MNAYLVLMANNNERFVLGLPPTVIDENGDIDLTAKRAPMSPETKAWLFIAAYLFAVTIAIPALDAAMPTVDAWWAKLKIRPNKETVVPKG